MPRVPAKIVLCLSLPCVAGACAGHGAPAVQARGPGMAARSAAAGADTFDVAYHGVGGAIRAPFRDFNIAHDRIPAALKRAAAHPYDMAELKGCAALTEEIAALDLALGPDLDTPDVEKISDLYARGASLAGEAALDAMRSAAVGYVPMRSVVRRLSGADRLEKRMKKAVLAGSVRRGFLKAIGMERGCAWPAAPLGAPVDPVAAPVVIAAAAPAPPPAIAPAPASPRVPVSAPAMPGSSSAGGGTGMTTAVAAFAPSAAAPLGGFARPPGGR